jgi:hypothetical protein
MLATQLDTVAGLPQQAKGSWLCAHTSCSQGIHIRISDHGDLLYAKPAYPDHPLVIPP